MTQVKQKNTEQLETLPGERGLPTAARAHTKKGSQLLFGIGVLVVFLAVVTIGYSRLFGDSLEESIPSASLTQKIPQRDFVEPPSLPRERKEPSISLPASQETIPTLDLDFDTQVREPTFASSRESAFSTNRPKLPVFDKSRSSLMATQKNQTPSVSPQNQVPDDISRALTSLRSFGQTPQSEAGTSTPQEGTLSSRLSFGTSTGTAKATFLGNRNYLLAKGSFIDCVLNTRLDSTVPGMTSCVVTRNIFSDNGAVLLIERGSTVVGEYQANVSQGQARIFVLWNRIKTPNGVIVDLNSPGTDALGGAGVPGQVSNKFFARFGGAILLSLIDDMAGAAVNALSQGDNQVFNFGNTAGAGANAATEALRSTGNIQPTLTKHQGELVGIYVARDLDFSEVYHVSTQ